jgi:hypothetical protein
MILSNMRQYRLDREAFERLKQRGSAIRVGGYRSVVLQISKIEDITGAARHCL